jgi:stage V sporulation protein R
MDNLLYDSPEWTNERLERVYDACQDIAEDELGLDTYPNQIEIVSSDQMIAAQSSIGLPIMYHHWSFGKQFMRQKQQYKRGVSGLPYELVINSNPCVNYLMEGNGMTLQTLVIAHAAFGHNAFFKSNRLFQYWTDAEAIVDYLRFAKRFISDCIQTHGPTEVELVLDACHSLKRHGVDKYKKPAPLSEEQQEANRLQRLERDRKHRNFLWDELMEEDESEEDESFPEYPEENLLYFVEKNAPDLEEWKREIIRIVRKIQQYLYPQAQTKVMNEGFATFTHYYIMNRLYEKEQIPEWSYLRFLKSHTNVINQPEFGEPGYRSINPYALGFAMFQDIRRICEAPTDEDRKQFPDLAGSDWKQSVLEAMRNYRDESFIQQYLSKKVMKDFRLFAIEDDADKDHIKVTAIHRDRDFAEIRSVLAHTHDRASKIPNIEVVKVDRRGDRTLTLRYTPQNDRKLKEDEKEHTLEYLRYLWEYPVEFE